MRNGRDVNGGGGDENNVRNEEEIMKSPDGAHFGMNAYDAVNAVLGGKEPPRERLQTVEEMRDDLLSAPLPEDGDLDYGEASRRLAGCFLRLVNEGVKAEQTELWEAYKAKWPTASTDFTGFMVGWAMNAARRCAGVPPAANPAICIFNEKGGNDLREA